MKLNQESIEFDKMVNDKYLYHFTSRWHLPQILETGFLKLQCSNISMTDPTRKMVVWLTTEAEIDPREQGLYGSCVDKSEIRLTVLRKPHFKHWKVWSRNQKHDKRWIGAIEHNMKPETWWISREVIMLKDVVEICNMHTGEVYSFGEYARDVPVTSSNNSLPGYPMVVREEDLYKLGIIAL